MLKWYQDSVFVATICLTIIAGLTIWLTPAQAKDIVTPIVTGICGFVTGYAVRHSRDTDIAQLKKIEDGPKTN